MIHLGASLVCFLLSGPALENTPILCQQANTKPTDEMELERLIKVLTKIKQDQQKMTSFFLALYPYSSSSFRMPLLDADEDIRYKNQVYRKIYEEIFGKKDLKKPPK